MEKELQRSLSLLEEKEGMVASLSAENGGLVEELKGLRGLESEVMASMEWIEEEKGRWEASVKELEERVKDREMALEVERKARGELEEGMEEVAAAMDAAQEMFVEMEGRADVAERARDGLVRWVRGRLGLGAKDVEAVIEAGGFSLEKEGEGHGEGEGSSDEDDTYPSHTSVLMRANKALEEALVRRAVPVEKVDVFVSGNGEDGSSRLERVAVPVFTSREAEEVSRLRGELAVAREVALQAEAELMLVRDGAKAAGGDVEAAHDVSDGDGPGSPSSLSLRKEAEKWREDALEKIVDLEETLNATNEKLESVEAENQQLASLLETAISNKDALAADQSQARKRANGTFVQMQKEMQSLRAELYAAQRSLSSKEAKIASLQATQQFSLDISDWDTLDVGIDSIDSIDPSSAPIEFLVRSLLEAAQMQAELLESLSEHAFERAEGREALAAVERDLERALSVLTENGENKGAYECDSVDIDGKPGARTSSFVRQLTAIERAEAETLRGQVEKSVAIQQGQAEAYSLLAKRAREKEAELKSKVKDYEAVLREHEAIFADLETAVPAVRASLAKLALVEEGEDAAAAILRVNGGDSDRHDKREILELAVIISDKLTGIAQAMTDGTLASAMKSSVHPSSLDVDRVLEREARYKAQYEAAKAEARHATAALEDLKRELCAGRVAMSPASHSVCVMTPSGPVTAATSGAIQDNDLLGFVTRFEELLEESSRLEDRIRALEDENARLLAAKGRIGGETDAESLASDLAEAKAEIIALQTANRQQLDHIEALRQELGGTHASLESAIRKQTLQSDRHVDDLSQLKDVYEGQVAQLKLAAEADRNLLLGMVDAAAEETSNLHDTLADAEEKLNRLERRLEEVEAEKQTLERQQLGFMKGHVRRTDAISAEAALAQAKAERVKRLELEKKVSNVTRYRNGLFKEGGDVGKAEGETLDEAEMAARLKEAQARINELEGRLVDGDDGIIKAKWGEHRTNSFDEALDALESDVVNLMVR